MPAIVSSNLCLFSPAYSPIVWRIREYTISGVLPPVMRIKFYLDGGLVHDMLLTHIESSQAPPTYYFEVNAQEIFSAAVSNLETLLADGDNFLILPVHEVYITITPLLDSGVGYLVEDPGETITSPEALMVNAYRFSSEGICLDDYASAFVVSGTPIRKWLTRRVTHQEVCKTNPFYLSGLTRVAIQFYRFVTYNEAGTQIATDDWEVANITPNATLIMDVSPNGINSLDPGQWVGSGISIDENVYRYTVQTINNRGEFCHEIFNLYPVSGCCDYQIVFLNSFGAYECFDIAQEDVMNYAVSGEVYTSSRLLPSEAGYMMSRGEGFLFKEGRNIFQFALPQSRDANQDFYRDMLNSSDVYLRFQGDLIPVTMSTATVNLRSNFNIVVSLRWSNSDRSQSN